MDYIIQIDLQRNEDKIKEGLNEDKDLSLIDLSTMKITKKKYSPLNYFKQ